MESNWKSQHAQAAHEDRDKGRGGSPDRCQISDKSSKHVIQDFFFCTNREKNAMLLLMSRITSNIYESKRLQSEELNGPNIRY